TAFVDGEPAGTIVLLCGEADSGARDGVRVCHAVEGHTDARGAFVFAGLLPAAYAVELRVKSGNTQIAVPHGEWLHVAAGERPLPRSADAVAGSAPGLRATADCRVRKRDPQRAVARGAARWTRRGSRGRSRDGSQQTVRPEGKSMLLARILATAAAATVFAVS